MNERIDRLIKKLQDQEDTKVRQTIQKSISEIVEQPTKGESYKKHWEFL